jgi:hypothetical protein
LAIFRSSSLGIIDAIFFSQSVVKHQFGRFDHRPNEFDRYFVRIRILAMFLCRTRRQLESAMTLF